MSCGTALGMELALCGARVSHRHLSTVNLSQSRVPSDTVTNLHENSNCRTVRQLSTHTRHLSTSNLSPVACDRLTIPQQNSGDYNTRTSCVNLSTCQLSLMSTVNMSLVNLSQSWVVYSYRNRKFAAGDINVLHLGKPNFSRVGVGVGNTHWQLSHVTRQLVNCHTSQRTLSIVHC